MDSNNRKVVVKVMFGLGIDGTAVPRLGIRKNVS